MKRLIALALLLPLLLIGTRASIAQQQGLPAGSIAFVHEDSGTSDPQQARFNLRLMNAQNPAQQAALTNFTLSLRLEDPVWSKDYRQLAFSGDFNNGLRSLEEMSVYAINADGTNLRVITGFGLLADLPGPTGTVTGRVMAGGSVMGPVSGCIVSAQGSSQTASCDTNGTFTLNNVPQGAAWLRAQATVNDPLCGPELSVGFVTITVQPGQVTNAGTITIQPSISKSIQPSWSRDGTRMILTSQVRSIIKTTNPTTGAPECRPTRGNQLIVWDGNVPRPVSLPGNEVFDLSGSDWSPTQDRIACAASGTGAGQSFVVVMNSDGSNAQAVYQVPFDLFGPLRFITQCRWNPDGRRIAFIQTSVMADLSSAWSDLFVVNVNGTGLRQLTRAAASQFVTSPSWSPDGRYLAFDVQVIPDLIRLVPQRSDIYAIRADGSGLIQLTNDGRSFQPAWGR